MNKLNSFLIIILIFPTYLFTQTLNIHKYDSTIIHVNLGNIDSISFTTQSGGGLPCPGIPAVEYEGQIYNTVQIGDQCWLKENLNVGKMKTSNSEEDNQTDNGIIEKYCYDNDEANCNIYGGLYQWHEAMQYSTVEGAQGICPPGWHIPTSQEFETLTEEVNDISNELKAVGQGEGDGAGTNTSGFSALLAGYRIGDFAALEFQTFFWSSTTWDNVPHRMCLESTYNDCLWTISHIDALGVSVRCLKDKTK